MSKRLPSECRAMISRTTQAKQAIERVMDILPLTYEPALGMAIDRLMILREQADAELPESAAE